MAAKLTVLSIVPAKSVYPAKDGFMFEIRFRSTQAIPEGSGWRFVYVGATQQDTFELLLDEFDVPAETEGIHQFTAVIPSLNYSLFPCIEEVFDVGAIIITACFKGREFFRCSFLVTHRYENPQDHMGKPFTEDGLIRAIYTDEPPRVIVQEKFCWDDPASVANLIQNDQIINQIREFDQDMQALSTQSNPFEINENSLFHPQNLHGAQPQNAAYNSFLFSGNQNQGQNSGGFFSMGGNNNQGAGFFSGGNNNFRN